MERRDFISNAAMLLAGTLLSSRMEGFEGVVPTASSDDTTFFETSDKHYQAVYSHALATLQQNVITGANYPDPVLIEGAEYGGIWMECAPQEGLVYSLIRPDVARNNHLAFFTFQREDGQIPGWVRKTTVGFAQIQMVVPIAATAWELAKQTGDDELLLKAYESCSRWDAWLRRYRDTRHTGLCEGFCTYDTGHDNSPRWVDMPNRCPDGDARKCPPIPSLPRLCPDLSATVYGGRMALASMARALGKASEEDRWLADAHAIRSAIIRKLYSEEDAAFYDVDAQNQFVRIRSDVISRVLGEHVVDKKMFDTIYRRQIHNPSSFWAPFPLASIALDDRTFVRPIPRNSWGGASQALTALRVPRWMEHYGKAADLGHLMQKWIEAILRADKFVQQLDPMDGSVTAGESGYSPAALVFLDFTWRLAGVRKVDDSLEWNIRPAGKDIHTTYRLRLSPACTAELRYSSAAAEMQVNGKLICRVADTVRVITDREGKLKQAVGIGEKQTTIALRITSGTERKITVEPNRSVNL